MKSLERYIGLCLILVLVIVITMFFEYKTLENFENISMDIGNVLCEYFYNISYSFIENKEYTQEMPDVDFIRYLPSVVPVDKIIRDQLINNGFTTDELEKEIDYNTTGGLWLINSDRRALYWQLMKPFIHKTLDEAFRQTGLKKREGEDNYMYIHFRCSDTPFVRHAQYHLQKYSYFKECLEDVKHLGLRKIKLVSCSFHRGDGGTAKKCELYIHSLVNYLNSLGYEVEIQCKSNIEDFASLFYAPVIISTGGSYSFMSGYFGKGVFLAEGHFIEDEVDGANKKCQSCSWLKHGHSLLHSEVKDYYDTDTVIGMLREEGGGM